MSSWRSPTKRRKKVVLNCRRKVAHVSQEAAQAALDEVRQNGKLSTTQADVYKCVVCGLFHWGRPVNPELLPYIEAYSLACAEGE